VDAREQILSSNGWGGPLKRSLGGGHFKVVVQASDVPHSSQKRA
jgi:hypothetical protein